MKKYILMLFLLISINLLGQPARELLLDFYNDTNPPPIPSGLTVTGSIAKITITSDANTAVDFLRNVLYRNSTNDASTSSAIDSSASTSISIIDTPLTEEGVYYYWAKSVDNSGNRSSFSSVAYDTVLGSYLLKIILSGDIQVEQTAEFATVRTSVDSMNSQKFIDAILFAGDLGWAGGYQGGPEGNAYYDSLYNILAELNVPYYFTSGNHDNDIIQSTSDSNFTAFQHFVDLKNALVDSGGYLYMDTLKASDGWALKGDFTLVFRGHKILFANSSDTVHVIFYSHENNSSASAAAGGYNADMWINPDTVWLKATLDTLNRPNNWVILSSHYPPFAWGWYVPSDYGNFTDTTEVREIINNYDNILFAHNQHVHQWHIDTSDSKIKYVVASRMADGASAFAGESAGFYVCRIYTDSISFNAVQTGTGTIGYYSIDTSYSLARNYATEDTSLLRQLISWWSLDEQTGTRLDSHGSNNLSESASPVNSIWGLRDSCASFDSTNYLSATDNDGLSAGDYNWTISAWVKIDNLIGGETKVFLSKGNNGTNPDDAEYLLYWSTANRLNMIVRGTDSTKILTANSFGAIVADTWYHVLAWRDSTNHYIHIRINDSAEDSLSTDQYKDGGLPFMLGQYGVVGNMRKFKGEVDEVSMWKRLLTSAEKTYLYNNGFGRIYINNRIW